MPDSAATVVIDFCFSILLNSLVSVLFCYEIYLCRGILLLFAGENVMVAHRH